MFILFHPQYPLSTPLTKYALFDSMLRLIPLNASVTLLTSHSLQWIVFDLYLQCLENHLEDKTFLMKFSACLTKLWNWIKLYWFLPMSGDEIDFFYNRKQKVISGTIYTVYKLSIEEFCVIWPLTDWPLSSSTLKSLLILSIHLFLFLFVYCHSI